MTPEHQNVLRLYRSGDWISAEAACKNILEQCPKDPHALYLMGAVAHQQGCLEESLACLRSAIEQSPRSAVYHNHLAVVLGQLSFFPQSCAAARRAIGCSPGFAEAHNNLGVSLEKLGRLGEALDSYRRAVSLRADYSEAHDNCGNVLRALRCLEEAAACHRRAIELRPDYATAYNNFAATLTEQGCLEEATSCYRRSVQLRPASAAAHSDLLYFLHYDPSLSEKDLFQEHLTWARRHASRFEPSAITHPNDRDPDRILRVGYLSPNLREHATTRFLEPALREHDRSQVEVFCYADVTRPDATTQRLQSLGHKWRVITGMSDDAVAELVRLDGIDILVDQEGHAGGNRLLVFARRPTPVQVTFNGYVATTGLSAIGYRLTDALHDPEGVSDRYYTEQLIRLPQCNWCYQPDEDSPEVSPLPALKTGHVTFGSLNKVIKVTPQAIKLWAEILRELPSARLGVAAAGGESNSAVRHKLQSGGIPGERLELWSKAPTRRAYLERFHRVDICLDTFPFNGITTTCDSLWMGVPVITLAVDRHVARAGVSLLTNIGHPELIAATPQQYVEIATLLGGDRERLSSLRQGLRAHMIHSPLRDAAGYARKLEAAYRAMWRSWCSRAAEDAGGSLPARGLD